MTFEVIPCASHRLYKFPDKFAYHVFDLDGVHVGNIGADHVIVHLGILPLSKMVAPERPLTEAEAAEGCNWEPGDKQPLPSEARP